MDFQNNKLMLLTISGLFLTLVGILSVKLPLPSKAPEPQVIQPDFEPKPFPGKGYAYGRNKTARADIVVERAKYVEGGDAVLFALKAACRENVARINTSVEMWNIMKERWPNVSLSDIGRDIDYFPSGVPQCPVDGTAYRLDPVTHRVSGHAHQEIKAPAILEGGLYYEDTVIQREKRVKKPKKDKPEPQADRERNDNENKGKQK